MNRNGLRKVILGGVIAALSTWYGLRQFLGDAAPSPADAAATDVTDIEMIVGQLSTAATIPQPAPPEPAPPAATPWPADPFFRFAAPERAQGRQVQTSPSASGPRFLLNAIISGQRPLAMINGTVHSVGERLADGSTIVAIGEYAVTLQGPQGPWTLELPE
jgi:hypothetical protein